MAIVWPDRVRHCAVTSHIACQVEEHSRNTWQANYIVIIRHSANNATYAVLEQFKKLYGLTRL